MMKKRQTPEQLPADDELLRRFVETFLRDDLEVPIESTPTPLSGCRELEARLPAPFPPLYRQLILAYRYPRVTVGDVCFLANPPSPGLTGLEAAMFRDELLSRVLLRHGYLQFGSGGGGLSYDPVCFNAARRRGDGDMEVVRLDHEQILCYERIRVQAVLAPSFREFVVMAAR